MTEGEVEVENLQMVYDSGEVRTEAISDISLTVNAGEFLSVIGPSGCGKSTFLYLIAGFLTPTDGTIHVDGNQITGPGTDRGVVFQEYALFPWLTVRENVTYGLKQQGMRKAERQETAEEYIALMELNGSEDKYPKELSGGMKQRVALARTLAYDPKILLMDEPFGALDQPLRESLQDHLLDIWRQLGKTVIFVTHQVEEATYLSERILVMSANPGRKKDVLSVDLDRSRSREEIMTSDVFTETTQLARKRIQEETAE